MAKAKKYQELTPAGQKKRLAKYEKEHAANGTSENLVRLVREATIKNIKDGNKQAIFRFALYEKGVEETRFVTAKAFIGKGKDALEQFYRSLTPQHLLSATLKENNGHLNVWKVIDRTENYNAIKAAKAAAQVEEQTELPLEV